ncbi:MAG: hypothetical protein HY231_26610 [Acidobacteria bacterium]|nr:hypothetical protein [Acidobacteriota bacterium]
MPTILVNPFNEQERVMAKAAPRLDTLAGKTLGLLDISKPGGNIFLDQLERLLKARYQVKEILRKMKPTFTKPAPDALIQELRRCDAVIEALAD